MFFFPFHKEDYFFWAVFSVNVWSAALKFHRTFKVPTAENVFCTLLLQLDVWPWRRRMMYEQSLMIEGCFFFFTSICWRGRGESFSLLTWTSEFNMFYLRVEFRTWQLVFFQWVRWGNLRLPVQVGFFNRVVESGGLIGLPYYLYETFDFVYFVHFKTSSQLLLFIRRMLRRFFVVKLQQLQCRGEKVMTEFFIVGWTYP